MLLIAWNRLAACVGGVLQMIDSQAESLCGLQDSRVTLCHLLHLCTGTHLEVWQGV